MGNTYTPETIMLLARSASPLARQTLASALTALGIAPDASAADMETLAPEIAEQLTTRHAALASGSSSKGKGKGGSKGKASHALCPTANCTGKAGTNCLIRLAAAQRAPGRTLAESGDTDLALAYFLRAENLLSGDPETFRSITGETYSRGTN